MKHALAYSQTGHLCLSTLHANNANQSLERIIDFFPEQAKYQLLFDLAINLRAIISLRLVPGVAQQRAPAVEVLINSPYIANLIEKGKLSQENAIKYADSKNNVALQIRLNESGPSDITLARSLVQNNP